MYFLKLINIFFFRERKERDHQREKERFYREKANYENYKETYAEYVNERAYRERKEESSKTRHAEFRKYQEKKERELHERHPDTDKHRREKHEEEKREKLIGDKTLQDLRERLLSKRGNKSEEDHHKLDRSDHRERRMKDYEGLDSALQGEAGMYVKEIINISTDDRRYQKEPREDDKLTEEERAEQELRREKLLEAGKIIYKMYSYVFLRCFDFICRTRNGEAKGTIASGARKKAYRKTS